MRSESFNFKEFCKTVSGLEYMELLDAIGEEDREVRQIVKKNTSVCKFADETKEDSYHKDLTLLLRLLVGHKVSLSIREGFLDDISDLFKELSKEYDFSCNNIEKIIEFAGVLKNKVSDN